MTTITNFLRTTLPLSLATLFTLTAPACDLPDKDLGDDPAASSDDGGACVDGEMMMQDCNTCTCENGGWSCTEIACGDGSGDGDSGGMACDPAEEPMPQCGECDCVDGEWLCTAIGCETTGGEECIDGETMMQDCNECTCIEGGWACTDMACDPAPVTLCDGTEPNDALFITDAFITEDLLTLTAEHSGGCGTHVFGSCWDGAFDESAPVQTGLDISHQSNDPCEAIEQSVLSFDLTPMRDAWVDAYGMGSGTIIINVDGFGAVNYDF